MKDRFAHYEASFNGGTIITKPFVVDGCNLHVNVKSDYGCVDVELLDEDRNIIEKFPKNPISCDSVDKLVVWSENIRDIIGERPVRLRFTLKNARLFSFWFE